MSPSALPLIPSEASPPAVRPAVLERSPDELRAWFAARGQPAMRVKQVRGGILARRAESFEQMTDLPRTLRAELAAEFEPLGSRVSRHLVSLDGTHKLLLDLADGKQLECVLIQEENRRTACVSTQVGCGMGCVFCASGLNGLERNLSAGEILEQLVRVRNLTAPGERLTHVVVMGMGEPLANLDNLLAALETAGDPDGLGIGARHVTISTVGLPAKIRRLADLGKQYHLAVSLHAPNDALRNQIVPTNEAVGIRDVLDAADYFFRTTGRQVTFEYILLGGLNDTVSHGRELGRLLHGRKAHVNLIPWNAVEGLPFREPTPEGRTAFIEALRKSGVSVTVRKRRGADIDAACGQLRRRAMQPG
jgi:23S rRNA (adenine2503-C2)-methyltransferase